MMYFTVSSMVYLTGHETFSNVGSGEADKEYQAFKHHMDQIHVALTSPSLHDPSVDGKRCYVLSLILP